ncbi:unnamed protein product [Discula destructiva]
MKLQVKAVAISIVVGVIATGQLVAIAGVVTACAALQYATILLCILVAIVVRYVPEGKMINLSVYGACTKAEDSNSEKMSSLARSALTNNERVKMWHQENSSINKRSAASNRALPTIRSGWNKKIDNESGVEVDTFPADTAVAGNAPNEDSLDILSSETTFITKLPTNRLASDQQKKATSDATGKNKKKKAKKAKAAAGATTAIDQTGANKDKISIADHDTSAGVEDVNGGGWKVVLPREVKPSKKKADYKDHVLANEDGPRSVVIGSRSKAFGKGKEVEEAEAKEGQSKRLDETSNFGETRETEQVWDE